MTELTRIITKLFELKINKSVGGRHLTDHESECDIKLLL
jgi:hypothetical protein